MTVHECVARAAASLVAAGFSPEDARRDAGVLARFALGWSLADWTARARERAPDGFGDEVDTLVARRAKHEPVAYITGVREFYGRRFRVDAATLIPRPETEGLIQAAIEIARASTAPGCIVDVGTGSGCIAISLALELPGSHVVATDISGDALDIARGNAMRLGAGHVRFERVHASAFLPPGLPPAQLIVTNPPYVPERDRQLLSRDVRDFEPAAALFAGDDGLDVIRALVPAAARALAAGGSLVMEIGAGQAGIVSDVVTHAGLELDGIRPDLQGIPRVVVAHRRG